MIRNNGIEIDRRARTISHRGVTTKFNEHGQKNDVAFPLLCHLILGAGTSIHGLFHLIYGNDPDGGPIEGPHVFSVRMNQCRHRYLRALGLQVRKWRISGVSFYCVVPIYEVN